MKSFELLEYKKNDFACFVMYLDNAIFSQRIIQSLTEICESYFKRPLKGFRKNTVPTDLIEVRYRERVFNHEKDRLIDEILSEAMKLEELKDCLFSKKMEVLVSNTPKHIIYKLVIFSEENKITEEVDQIFENFFKNQLANQQKKENQKNKENEEELQESNNETFVIEQKEQTKTELEEEINETETTSEAKEQNQEEQKEEEKNDTDKKKKSTRTKKLVDKKDQPQE